MTREEINVLDMDSLEKRAGEIAEETREATAETLETLTAELDAIEERKAAILAEAVEKRAQAAAVINGAGEVIEDAKKEERKMDPREVRSTKAYEDAYVEYVKKGYRLDGLKEEQRVLLTENADGTIAVPVYLEDRINTAWENDQIMSKVRRTFFPGNLKVGVEVSASGATIHQEGGDPIDEENLVVDFVELIPDYIKKMVKVSHTALALTGRAFLDYLYDEIEYQLVKKAGEKAVQDIITASTNPSNPLVATSTVANVDAPTTAELIAAEGLLGAGASDLVLITTRARAAALKAAAITASYGYDPFDGMTPVYVDASALGNLSFIVGDLSGVQANFPEGAEPRYIFDEYTEAPSNIVRIIGRLAVATGVVAAGMFTVGKIQGN